MRSEERRHCRFQIGDCRLGRAGRVKIEEGGRRREEGGERREERGERREE